MNAKNETQTTNATSPTPPRLERPIDDRIIAGVASGLADRFDISVGWTRLSFIVLSFFGGLGVLLYLVGWLAIPEEGHSQSIAEDKLRNLDTLSSWVGVGLIVLAAIIVLGNSGIVSGELLIASVLIVLGVLLYRGDLGGGGAGLKRPRREGEPASEAGDAGYLPSPAENGVDGDDVAEPGGGVAAAARARRPRDRGPRRPRSRLGRIAVAVLLVVLGVMGMAQSAGWVDPSTRDYVGVVFLVGGGSLVLGAFWGRARWLIVVGLLVTPFLLAAALVTAPLQGGLGERFFSPTAGSVRSEYRLAAGDMTLDLRNMALEPGAVASVGASVTFGRLQVIVPQGLGVTVTARTDVGAVYLADGDRRFWPGQGISIDQSVTYPGVGSVNLDLQVGFGEIDVYRTGGR